MGRDGFVQTGKFELTLFRADGDGGWRIERHANPHDPEGKWPNLFTTEGQNYLANLQATSPNSVVNHMIVGTATVAAAYASVVASLGEVDRNTIATRTSAVNVLTEVCTFAGGLDSITSLSIRAIGCSNDARSGQGILRALTVLGTGVVLANSDFLQVNYTTTVS